MNPIDWPSEIPPERTLTDAEVAAQADNPPFKSSLTIIWEQEKAEILGRTQALLERVEALEGRLLMFEEFFTALGTRIQALEHHILNLEGHNVTLSRN